MEKVATINLLKGPSCNSCLYNINEECSNWGQLSKSYSLNNSIELPTSGICEYWDSLSNMLNK